MACLTLLVLVALSRTSDAVRRNNSGMIASGGGNMLNNRSKATFHSMIAEDLNLNLVSEMEVNAESEDLLNYEDQPSNEAESKSFYDEENNEVEDFILATAHVGADASLARLDGKFDVKAALENPTMMDKLSLGRSIDSSLIQPKLKRSFFSTRGNNECIQGTRRKLEEYETNDKRAQDGFWWLTPFCTKEARRANDATAQVIEATFKKDLKRLLANKRKTRNVVLNERRELESRRNQALRYAKESEKQARTRDCAARSAASICFCRWFATIYRKGKRQCKVRDVENIESKRGTKQRIKALWDGKDIAFPKDNDLKGFFCNGIFTSTLSRADRKNKAPKLRVGGAQRGYEKTRKQVSSFANSCEEGMLEKLTDWWQGGSEKGRWLTPYCQQTAMIKFDKGLAKIREKLTRDRRKAGGNTKKRDKVDIAYRVAYLKLENEKKLAATNNCLSTSVKHICFCRWFATKYKHGTNNCTLSDVANTVSKGLTKYTKQRITDLWDRKYIEFRKNKFCESTFVATLREPKLNTQVSRSIHDAAKTCTKVSPDVDVLLKPCVGTQGVHTDGYCMDYCKTLRHRVLRKQKGLKNRRAQHKHKRRKKREWAYVQNDVDYCKGECPKWCLEAKDKMWQTNAPFLKEAVAQNRSQVRKERHFVLEGMLRRHSLLCVCVNRKHNGGDDTSICYGEPGGIPYTKNWCQFADTPSYRMAYQKLHPKQIPGPFANHCEDTKGVVQMRDIRQTWTALGLGARGLESHGVLVREHASLDSREIGRLAPGSKVREIDIKGGRLNYKKVSGDGPESGWVSISLQGKRLLSKDDMVIRGTEEGYKQVDGIWVKDPDHPMWDFEKKKKRSIGGVRVMM